MKKKRSLQILLLMSLSIGSTFMIESYGGLNKYADRYQKLHNVNRPTTMKSIESEMRKIKREFQKNHEVKIALNKLDALIPKIKALIAQFKLSEKHGKMWEVHEHTLHKKLREVRDYVRNHSQK